MKFLEIGMVDDGQPALTVENLAEILANQAGIYKGTLKVFVLHAENLVKADDGDKDYSDPYIIFKIPGGKQAKSTVIQNNQDPVWKTIYSMPITMPHNQLQPMRLEIYDSDLVGDDLLGYININLKESLENPQKWHNFSDMPLDGTQKLKEKHDRVDKDMGRIFLQIMYVQDGIKNEDPPLPMDKDMDVIKMKEMEEKKKPIKGLIVIFIPMARGLKVADSASKSSDPYVSIKFPDGKKRNTKAIQKKLDPVWNYQDKYKIDIVKEDYKPIEFTVLDEDTAAIDDELGKVRVEWLKLFENPLTWLINNVYKLEGKAEKGESLGEIYIQMKFIPESELIKSQLELSKITDKQLSSIESDFPKTLPDPTIFPYFGRIIGVIDVEIISGTELKNTDFMGKSDPFVVGYFSGNPEAKFKTDIKKDELNPVWNFKAKIFFNHLRIDFKNQYLFFDVYDEDNVRDELIGRVKIDPIDIMLKPEEKIDFDEILLNPADKDGKSIEKLGNLQFNCLWTPNKVYCESLTEPEMKAPEKEFVGKLYVKIVCVKQLVKQPNCYVEVILDTDKRKPQKLKTKPVAKKSNDPDFNEAFNFDIKIGERTYSTLKLQFVVREKGIISDDILGFCSIAIKDYIDQSGKWFQDFLPLKSKIQTESMEKPGAPKIDEEKMSYLGVLFQYRKDGEADIDTNEAKLDFNTYIGPKKVPTIPGILTVNIYGARGLKPSFTDTPDPFAQIQLNKGKIKPFATKRFDDNLQPVWDTIHDIELNIPEKDWEFLKLTCTVFDYDFACNDILGRAEVDISGLFQKPGTWINEIFPLLDEDYKPGAGEVYLQIQWKPQGLEKIDPTPENLFQKEQEVQKAKLKQKQEEEEKKAKEPTVNGKLNVRITEAYSLLKGSAFDTSDPFVQIKVNKGLNKIIQSPVIDDNPNPVWNFETTVGIKLFYSSFKDIAIKESEFSDIRFMITVLDYDTVGKNGFLGCAELKMDEYFSEKAGQWYNELIQLCNEQIVPGKNGILSMQAQFVRDGQQVQDIVRPEPIPAKNFFAGKLDPVGILVVHAVAAYNIMKIEKTGSKAYMVIKLNKKSQETKKSKELTDNPKWDEYIEFPCNYQSPGELPFLQCELRHNTTFSSTFIGEIEVNIQAVLESQYENEWAIKEKYPVTDLKKQGPKNRNDLTGDIELRIGFISGKDQKQLKTQVLALKNKK